MRKLGSGKDRSSRGVAIGAAALGAVAVGAFAIGVLAIGRLVIRRLLAGQVEFDSFRVRDLAVTRLRVGELVVSDSLELPGQAGHTG
jgi:hypothetical protein